MHHVMPSQELRILVSALLLSAASDSLCWTSAETCEALSMASY